MSTISPTLLDFGATELKTGTFALSPQGDNVDRQLQRAVLQHIPRQREGVPPDLGGIGRREFGIGEDAESADLLLRTVGVFLNRDDPLNGPIAWRRVPCNIDDHILTRPY